MAMGLPLPERDRDAEFRATFSDPADMLRFVDSMSRESVAALDATEAVDWSEMRDTGGRGGDAPPQVAAAYALIHVTEHLRGHVDELSLMRRMWEGRAAAGQV
jgi:hypothetical protein